MKVKLLIEGGDMKPGPSIAQQLGPMGVNIGKVISEVNTSTREFKGMKVPVELDVDEKTKNFTLKISSPPTSELLKKEFSLEKGSNKISEIKVANASIEDVIKIAKIKHPNMLEKNLKSAVTSVLGTCASIGILVENKNSNELIEEVKEGRFDREINEEKTETPPEKRQLLNQYFDKIKSEQEARIAVQLAQQKAAEEAQAVQPQTGVKEGVAEVKEAVKQPEVKPVKKLEKKEKK